MTKILIIKSELSYLLSDVYWGVLKGSGSPTVCMEKGGGGAKNKKEEAFLANDYIREKEERR